MGLDIPKCSYPLNLFGILNQWHLGGTPPGFGWGCSAGILQQWPCKEKKKTRNLYTLFMTHILWGCVCNQSEKAEFPLQGTAYRLDERQYPEYDKKLRKCGNLKIHTLFSGYSSPYSPCMEVPPPLPPGNGNLIIHAFQLQRSHNNWLNCFYRSFYWKFYVTTIFLINDYKLNLFA